MKSDNRWDNLIIAMVLVLAVLGMVTKDYKTVMDVFTDGKTRGLIMACVVLCTWKLWRFNPAWALFAGWTATMWVWFDFQGWGVIDVMVIPACLMVGEAVRDRVKASLVFLGIASLSALQALYGIMQFFRVEPFQKLLPQYSGWPIGTIGHPTNFGVFCGLGAVYFFYETCRMRNWRNFFPFAVCLGGIAATGSTMSILAFVAGVGYMVYLFLPRLTLAAGAILAAVCGAGAYFHPEIEFFSFSGRLMIWPKLISAWLDSPIIGNGPGSWLGQLQRWGADKPASGMNWERGHNDFLQALPEHGAIGLLIVLVGLFLYYRKARSMMPVYGAWATLLCVDAMGNFAMHIPTFGLVAGWLAASVHQRTED